MREGHALECNMCVFYRHLVVFQCKNAIFVATPEASDDMIYPTCIPRPAFIQMSFSCLFTPSIANAGPALIRHRTQGSSSAERSTLFKSHGRLFSFTHCPQVHESYVVSFSMDLRRKLFSVIKVDAMLGTGTQSTSIGMSRAVDFIWITWFSVAIEGQGRI